MWVKENIDKFGGDPELITIFGQSAGAGSVSAQMMGRHNGELFQRAIQEVFISNFTLKIEAMLSINWFNNYKNMDIIYFYLQSGSLYTDWGWFNSENKLFEIRESIRNQHNCSKDESIYKCLENKSVDELLSTVVTDNPLVNHWHQDVRQMLK